MPAEPRWRIPFTRLLVLGFGLPLMAGLGLLLYLGLAGAEKNTRALYSRLVQSTMDSVVEQIHGHLRPVERQLEYLAAHLNRHPELLADSTALKSLLQGGLAATPQVLGLNYLDREQGLTYVGRDPGSLVLALGAQRPGQRLEPYFRSPPAGRVWLAPVWSPRLGRHVLPALMPVRVEGRLVGFLVAPITVDALSGLVERLSAQVGLRLFILYGEETVLAYPQRAEPAPALTPARGKPLPTLSQMDDPALAAFRNPERIHSDWLRLQGIDSHRLRIGEVGHLYFYRSLSGYGPEPWLVGGYLEQVSMPEELRRLVVLLAVGVALMLLMLALVVWFSRRIGASIERILAGFEAIGRRDLEKVPPMAGSRVRELDRVGSAFNRMLLSLREHQRIERLFGRYLPAEIARQLVSHEGALAPQQVRATILFCDLEGFTALCEQLQPGQIVTLLNSWFSAAVALIEAEGGLVTQFQGDAILAIFNVPGTQPDHARRALAAALKIQGLTRERRFEGQRLACRVGINTGEVVAGSVGARERLSYTVHGDAVNLAARLEALNKEHGTRVLLSEASAREIGGDALVAIAEVEIRGRRRHETLYTPVALLGSRESAER